LNLAQYLHDLTVLASIELAEFICSDYSESGPNLTSTAIAFCTITKNSFDDRESRPIAEEVEGIRVALST
jgi:hypothetical protein